MTQELHASRAAGRVRWPVDGHVHFHRPELVAATLEAAAANFRRTDAAQLPARGMLLLTQAARERVFEQIADESGRGGWRFEPLAAEPETILARRADDLIAIVCGRQVRARGGLEVLALGTRREFVDGRPFEDTAAEVQASGAVAVVPWGFGKWLGPRGTKVRALLESASPRRLCVGDNGGRLQLLAVPALIRDSEMRGFRVLPGTDPFPFGEDYRRVGSFGFFADVAVDETAPWRSVRAWLEASRGSPAQFGSACNPARFVVNQVGMQLYSRLARKAGT